MKLVHHLTDEDRKFLIYLACLIAIPLALISLLPSAVGIYLVHQETKTRNAFAAQNERRLAENIATAEALCRAAGGARDFWKKVRASTILELSDYTLSKTQKLADQHFVAALTEVIRSADGLAHSCRSKE